MTAELLVRATDGSNYNKGAIVTVKPEGQVWGRMEQPPNYIHLTVTEVTPEQVMHYIYKWDIKFQHEILAQTDLGYRIRVSVDPAYISASDVGKNEMKNKMSDWIANEYGGQSITFSYSSITADIPKPVDLQKMKGEFADIFNDVIDLKRYYFTDEDIETALSMGGKITLTKAQALNRIKDKVND